MIDIKHLSITFDRVILMMQASPYLTTALLQSKEKVVQVKQPY